MSEQKSLASIYDELSAPFPIEQIELLPGATTRDKTKALALPYADIRVYQARLDEIVGPDGWHVAYRPWTEGAVICVLTIYGVSREDVGECAANDTNRATSAVAQAFKRTCSAFGLGRYLYNLPQEWAEYDEQRKQIANPQAVIAKMYSKMGLSRTAPKTAQAQPPELTPRQAEEKFYYTYAKAVGGRTWHHVATYLGWDKDEWRPEKAEDWRTVASHVIARQKANAAEAESVAA